MFATGIDPESLKTLQKIARTDLINHYYLAGGTACALYLNHRISHDLDFFSLHPIQPEPLRNQLIQLGKLTITQNEPGTFNGQLDNTKISFFAYPYEFIDPPKTFEKTQIASLKDLACMKLESIASRGVKRDFVDLYQICQSFSLDDTIVWFKQKFKQQNISIPHVLKSLVYFANADDDPDPNMKISYDWEKIKTFFLVNTPRIAKQLEII